MAYEVVEIKPWIMTSKSTRMNEGETFEDRKSADDFMKSLLNSPKLGFIGFDWENDEEHDAADIAAFTKTQIRQFAIQPVQ
jgi:hypothetical protein